MEKHIKNLPLQNNTRAWAWQFYGLIFFFPTLDETIYFITVNESDYENRGQSIHFINDCNINNLIKKYKNKNYKPVSLMTKDVNIINKVKVHQIFKKCTRYYV